MEAARRWETEAIRESRARRRGRPVVSQNRTGDEPAGDWVTLREAADATGIPINTLRKWCRREAVDSYLESDGQLTLRIVELSSVRTHAADLGRKLTPPAATVPTPGPLPPPDSLPPPQGEVPPQAAEGVRAEGPETMIVPIDAWNKMLTQLGNLHEAGQQLAEARERAAKAETEARFLRERLADLRTTPVPPTAPPPAIPDTPPTPVPPTTRPPVEPDTPPTPVPPTAGRGDAKERSDDAGGPPAGQTTSFFRYVVKGWRGRKR